jgi:hypothetical protein
MNLKKTLDSGAVLEVTMADFKTGHRLFKAVMEEIKDVEMSDGDNVIVVIKNVATGILSSDKVEAMLWECMGRAIYNNQKVVPALFEDEQIREDYLVVAKEVLWFNLGPFLKYLSSLLSGMQENILNIRKQK